MQSVSFPQDTFKPKKDRFSKARGGSSEFLYITCGKCEEPVLIYQKDGPGPLLRCYSDRMVWPAKLAEEQARMTASTIKEAAALTCTDCGSTIGIPMIYEREHRPAYRVVPGSIHAYRSLEKAQAREQR